MWLLCDPNNHQKPFGMDFGTQQLVGRTTATFIIWLCNVCRGNSHCVAVLRGIRTLLDPSDTLLGSALGTHEYILHKRLQIT